MHINITRVLQYCIIILLLTPAVSFSLASPIAASSPEALIIKDNFTNPDSGWPEFSDDTAALTYKDGNFSIFIKRSNIERRCSNFIIGELSDFIAEVDIKESYPPKSGYVGLVFRMQDDLNNYAFLINNSNRTYQIVRRVSGIPQTLQSWTVSNNIKSEVSINHLKIICKGPQIEAYCNGYKLCTVRDTSITKGSLGFEVDTWVAPQEYLFSNLKVFRGIKAGFLTADSFRESTVLTQRLQAARADGFNVDTVEYYPVSNRDFTLYVNKLFSEEPTVIYIMCDPSEREALNSTLQGFNGEVRFDEVSYSNFLDFSISKIATSKSSYRGGDTLQTSVEINNPGFLSIARAVSTLNVIDPEGTSVSTSVNDLKPIPSGTVSNIQISCALPPFLKEGDYTVSLKITGYPDSSNSNLSRTAEAQATFNVAGSTFTINYVVLPLFALFTGAVIAWFVTRKKASKE